MTRIKALLQGQKEQSDGYPRRTHRSKKNRKAIEKINKAALAFKKKRQERKDRLIARRQENG